jgi:hypothetical protein
MLSAALCLTSTSSSRPGKMLNSAVGLPARVQIPVPPSANSRLLYELLVRVRLGFLVVSPFRNACVFLHVERGQSSKRVWHTPRIIYLPPEGQRYGLTGTEFRYAPACWHWKLPSGSRCDGSWQAWNLSTAKRWLRALERVRRFSDLIRFIHFWKQLFIFSFSGSANKLRISDW